MPRLNELQSSVAHSEVVTHYGFDLAVEETLVPDRRLRQTTSQMLEDKLRRLTGSRRAAGASEIRQLASARQSALL